MIGKEEREAVLRVMDSGILSGYKGNWSEAFYGGPEVKSLEQEWAKYFGVKHAIAINSATSGLWAACNAIGLKPGDEVIVTPYSMTCSASIPLLFGAKPVFADIEPDYFCLDPKSIEERITEHTKAIIVVDIFGQPYDADAINTIAKKHGIIVIEDAAQAPGAMYKGRYAGTLGDIGVYSLNVHKPIQCGEGGIVVTDNDALAFNIRLSMNHAEAVMNDFVKVVEKSPVIEEDKYWDLKLSMVGMNLRMTELSAAVAREQLKKLPGILEKIRSHAYPFGVKVRPNCQHAYYRYASTDGIKVSPNVKEIKIPIQHWHYRDEETGMSKPVFDTVNCHIKQHYITPIHRMPLFKHLGYDQNSCPVCDEVEENIVLAWLKGMG